MFFVFDRGSMSFKIFFRVFSRAGESKHFGKSICRYCSGFFPDALLIKNRICSVICLSACGSSVTFGVFASEV